jgi:hypothetical protein
MNQQEWLRHLSDAELTALVEEVQERAEQFSAQTRSLINDELRRRKMPVIGVGKSRH